MNEYVFDLGDSSHGAVGAVIYVRAKTPERALQLAMEAFDSDSPWTATAKSQGSPAIGFAKNRGEGVTDVWLAINGLGIRAADITGTR